jgi:signal peptidase II
MAEARVKRSVRPDGPLSALGLSVVLATLALDQAGKAAAKAWLAPSTPVDVLPILTLYRVDNEGIAFSLFRGAGGGVLTLVTLAITIVVLVMWARARDGGRLAALAFALIVGGALGNLVDRVLYGRVVDFLLLHFGGWTLFVFNIADAALTVGPLLLLLVYLRPAPAPD